MQTRLLCLFSREKNGRKQIGKSYFVVEIKESSRLNNTVKHKSTHASKKERKDLSLTSLPEDERL